MLDAFPRLRKPDARTVIATPEELEALIAAAQPWLRTIILLAAHAGLRRSDALQVAPIHYNAEAATISITQFKTKRPLTVPVSERLARHLQAAPADGPATPYYLAYRFGKPICTGAIEGAWQRLKKNTGVNRQLWLHDLRRTLAVSLYEVSKDIRVVEQMLGHKSLTSTAHYLEHRDPQKLRPYLEMLWRPKTQVIQ